MNQQIKEKTDGQNNVGDKGYYYCIRLYVAHPTMSVNEVTAVLGMDPDVAWNADEKTIAGGGMYWNLSSWTEGKRQFFNEVHQVLDWLEERQEFVSRIISTGGELNLVAQLPGSINIGDSLKMETMSLAVKLGVTLGVEVFPILR